MSTLVRQAVFVWICHLATLEELHEQLTCYFDLFDDNSRTVGQWLNESSLPRSTLLSYIDRSLEPDPVTGQWFPRESLLQMFRGSQPACATEPAALQSLKTFTCFPNLPVELRLKIWKHALPTSQIIELHTPNPDILTRLSNPAVPSTLLPVLQSCREARDLITSIYERAPLSTLAFTIPQTTDMLIDFKTDILYLPGPASTWMTFRISNPARDAQLARFQTVALTAVNFKFWFTMEKRELQISWLPRLQGLKTLLLVGRERGDKNGTELAFQACEGEECKWQQTLRKLWEEDMNTHEDMERFRDVKLVFVQPIREGKLITGRTFLD
jgi:hypothetical protein